MPDGDYYSKRSDLDLIFGAENIDRYAAAPNEGDRKLIDERVDWANLNAESYVNGRLMRGRYDIPFTKPVNVQMVIDLSASWAGIMLYATKRVASSDAPSDRMAEQRMNAERWIKEIMAGQLKLVDMQGNELPIPISYPQGSGALRDTRRNPLAECTINPFILPYCDCHCGGYSYTWNWSWCC